MKNHAADNGIYYFLGNITSHVLHALPLYEELGGTFVVLSNKARREVERYNVPVINIDDRPHEWQRFGFRLKPVSSYLKIGPGLDKTIEYLNEHAKVVLFYELFEFTGTARLTNPKRMFLTHGNMLKDYMNNSDRLRILEQYDYMSAIGPYLKKRFVEIDGIKPDRLVDLGIARTDWVIKDAGKVAVSKELAETLSIDPAKKIFSYLPTFWGASSVYHTGKELVRHFPNKYTLIVRPHPQTPKKILRDYKKIIKTKPNVIYAPEGQYENLGLLDLYRASSAFVGDVSSVMLEAILTEKPLVFSYDTGDHRQDSDVYKQIVGVVRVSQQLTPDTIARLEQILDDALRQGIETKVWRQTRDEIFYHADGTSVRAIASFVRDQLLSQT